MCNEQHTAVFRNVTDIKTCVTCEMNNTLVVFRNVTDIKTCVTCEMNNTLWYLEM